MTKNKGCEENQFEYYSLNYYAINVSPSWIPWNFSNAQGQITLQPDFIKSVSVFAKNFFQLQDSCLTDCQFLLVKTQFCRTVLYVIIVILVIFAGHLSDRIKYFVSQNKILLVLTDRPALFVRTAV